MRDYRKTADHLRRLAEDQAGKPEGEAAQLKLDELLAQHPELNWPPASAQTASVGMKIDPLLIVLAAQVFAHLFFSHDEDDEPKPKRKRYRGI